MTPAKTEGGEPTAPFLPSQAAPVLAGKVALVTGGSRGIGRAIVRKLASAGCDVGINYYNSHDEAEELAREVSSLGRRAALVPGNVGDPSSVEEIFAGFWREFDRLDFLISNAASGVLRPFQDLTLKHWRWCMETNALALHLLTLKAVQRMQKGGRIIALSSLGSERALPDYAFIGASKAALEALVRSLSMELAPRGIRVNAVSAGVVDTDALKAFPERERIAEEFRRRSAAGRLLTPEDVAAAVYLLCLPEAEMVCGQTLRVDAGYSIAG
jgi:enoyl-[acyl-carrier protein] reductase III